MIRDVGLLFCPHTSVTAQSFISYYGQDPRSDTAKLLDKINIPVLIIAGGQDNVIKDLPDRIKPIADSRKIVLAMIEDADHFFLDLFAEDVADHIEIFISPNC